MLQGETGVITSHRLAFSYRTCTVFAHQLKCIGAPEQQRRKSDGGFSLFVTAVWCVCSSPASGSALMPTHHHLPEIKTSWVWRVEQEEIETKGGGSGRVWGRRVKARTRRSLNRKRERGREICPWAGFVLNSTLFFVNPLQLLHNHEKFSRALHPIIVEAAVLPRENGVKLKWL